MLLSFFVASQFLPSFFAATCSAKPLFFFLKPWYEYLPLSTDPSGGCTVTFNFPSDIWAVVLAIIDDLLRLGGLVAVVSIIIAGVGYITAQGNPEKAASARRRIYNSLIGLVIIVVATAFVSFIGNKIGT